MNEENRQLLLKLCGIYLETKPEHMCGFCWWASGFSSANPEVYQWVEDCIAQMPQYADMRHVAEFHGYNEVRAQFVSDLRDYLQALKIPDVSSV